MVLVLAVNALYQVPALVESEGIVVLPVLEPPDLLVQVVVPVFVALVWQ